MGIYRADQRGNSMQTPTVKTWPTAVVLSLYTGRLLCDFGTMQELAEFLVGSSVWTHQFAHRPFVQEMQDALAQQHPLLREVDASAVDTENWMHFRDREVTRFGATLTVHPMGEPEHYSDALVELLAGKDVVTVKAPESVDAVATPVAQG